MGGTAKAAGVKLRRFVWRGLLLAGVASLQARPLILAGALIYRHDWAWPGVREQLIVARTLNGVPWSSDGLGAAAIAPLQHPLFYCWTVLGYLVGAHATLVISAIAALAVFGIGIASCTRRLWGLSEPTAIMLGMVAMLGPPFLNKLAAGHLYYLISLAAFPWVIRALAGGSRRPSLAFVVAAICVAFSVLQIQLYAVMIVVLVGAAFYKRNVPPWVRAVAVLGALLQIVPEIWAAIGHDPQAADAWMLPHLAWEYNNSSPFPAGLFFLGYAPHYAEHALSAAHEYGFAVFILETALVAALAGLFLQRSRMAAWLLGFGWAACTLLVLGLYGPLGYPLSFLFAHVPAFAVFRELYHFAGIGWALEVLLIGGIWGWRAAKIPLLAFASLAAIVFGAMWIPGDLANQIASYPVPAQVRERLLALSADRSDGRFLLWPAEWPLGPEHSASAGADPLAYPIGTHPVASTYRLSGPLEVAAGLIREGHKKAARKWLSAAGVDVVINEPWTTARLLDRAPLLKGLAPWMRPFLARSSSLDRPEERLPMTCMLCSYSTIPVVAEPEDWRSGDAFVLARDLNVAEPHCYASASFSASDPSTGWVDSLDWSWLDPRLAMMGAGVLTWSTRPLAIPRCSAPVGAAHLLLLAGKLKLDGKAVPMKIGSPTWLKLPPHAEYLSVHDGLLAVDSFASSRPSSMAASRESGALGRPLLFDWRTGTGRGILVGPTHWIVLKNDFSRNWMLRIAGGRVIRHIRASGYANAWEVRASAGDRVEVWYARWGSTVGAATIAIAALCAMGLWAIWLGMVNSATSEVARNSPMR